MFGVDWRIPKIYKSHIEVININFEFKFNKRWDILDWNNIAAGKPYVTTDLPAGGKRLMQETSGFVTTIVSGNITYLNGKATGKLPGTLVRRV